MKKIKLFDISFDNKEISAVKKTLESKNWGSGSGTGNVHQFESNFRNYVKSKSCVAVNSGTAALHLALSLFDIKNKEVILPSLSFTSTAHSVLYNGGIPKFVDVDPTTLCIDPKKIEEAISKKTRIILPVHFAGLSCSMVSIQKIAKKHKLFLIEDAAHATGTKFKSNTIGSHGDAVCFSFHPVKNLSMPSGGAITLNNSNWKTHQNLLKIRRWCGISNRKNTSYDVNEIGWNYYMNEIDASIGLIQLKKMEKHNSKRKFAAKLYSQNIDLEFKMPFDKEASYHFFWIRVKNRTEFMKKMYDYGVETGTHYRPIHTFNLYAKKYNLPNTNLIGKEIVSLPTHPNLSESDIDKIILLTNKFSK